MFKYKTDLIVSKKFIYEMWVLCKTGLYPKVGYIMHLKLKLVYCVSQVYIKKQFIMSFLVYPKLEKNVFMNLARKLAVYKML